MLWHIQERKEREAQAAEGGFTVVVHHKGRKKTTEVGSGTTMGSVAKAVVENKMAKKKGKEVVKLDFYRFQRREAQRNGMMNLIWKKKKKILKNSICMYVNNIIENILKNFIFRYLQSQVSNLPCACGDVYLTIHLET